MPLLPHTGTALAAAPTPTRGDACLRQVQEALVRVLNAAPTVDPSVRLTILRFAAKETADAQLCAQPDEQTREQAGQLKRMLELLDQRVAAIVRQAQPR
jgi:ABC-type sugar transport system substrate-binding protein